MKKIIYTNSAGQSIEFTYSVPFVIQKISGFGAIKNNIYTTKSANQDGQSCTGTSLDLRNPTLTGLLIVPSKDEFENYRRELIIALNPKIDGILTYINGDLIKSINCKVENAPVFGDENFNQQPFDISWICPNPFWEDISELKEEIALWLGDFSFELELTDDGIEMGHREPSLIVNVNNEGDVDCGMRIEFKALATVINPSILNVNTQEYIKINKTMSAGEVITVTTDFGNKKVKSTLNGVTTNAINYITDTNITFLQLEPGDNLFRYNADENIDNLEVSIYYTPQYLGV